MSSERKATPAGQSAARSLFGAMGEASRAADALEGIGAVVEAVDVQLELQLPDGMPVQDDPALADVLLAELRARPRQAVLVGSALVGA